MKNNNFDDLQKWVIENFDGNHKIKNIAKEETLLLMPRINQSSVSELHPDLFKLPNLKAIALKINSNNIVIRSNTLHTIFIDNNRLEEIKIDCPNLQNLSMKNQYKIEYNKNKQMLISNLTVNLVLKTPNLNDLEISNQIATSDIDTFKLVQKLKNYVEISFEQKSSLSSNIF